ncbi:Hypothetical protein FKW44_018656 [Caligus rogercresseyi]|uniref:Uncharacterized protein n=1 Tax=Caligus rogercresseyi TaxID=217165 RepID=A0A7T8JWV0_CALRO|nr:Hypothetical protein FKW44_018656 [Caligus rogercresseyi]
MLAYKKKPPQILSQAIRTSLSVGGKIFDNSLKTGRHQFSGQMRNYHGPGHPQQSK